MQPTPASSDTPDLDERVIALARTLDPDVEVIHIDPSLADTAAFLDHYGYSEEESCNCIVVVAKTGERAYAACLVQATRQLDLNKHARLLVGARKASFAPSEETVALTGMVPGGVTPIGLPEDLPIWIDEPIMSLDRIIIGGGGRSTKLYISPKALASQPQVTVAQIGR